MGILSKFSELSRLTHLPHFPSKSTTTTENDDQKEEDEIEVELEVEELSSDHQTKEHEEEGEDEETEQESNQNNLSQESPYWGDEKISNFNPFIPIPYPIEYNRNAIMMEKLPVFMRKEREGKRDFENQIC